MTVKEKILTYYRLTKPGIVYGNALIAGAAYFLGAKGAPDALVFLAMLFGIAAVMASACVFNNILDRDIDRVMKRTERRALVSGTVSAKSALLYGSLLLIFGFILLLAGTNIVSALVALFGHFAYVVLYGIAKRLTKHGTLVGTISGSTPPIIGYTAATGQIDVTAILLFIVLVAWQMPHFYAIAIFRRADYSSAKIPVLPIVEGIKATRRQIIAYVMLFIVTIGLLWYFSSISLLGTLVITLAGLYWLYLCIQPTSEDTANAWARGQFVWSLKLLLILSFVWSLDSFLH